FRSVVRHAQGFARRLMGHDGTADKKYLAEFLHARSARPLRRLSHLRPLSPQASEASLREAHRACGTQRLKITIVQPAPRGTRKGKRVTAVRWRRLLQELGHRINIQQDYGGERCDVLIALHARHSYAAIESFRRAYPDRPVILVLTGTDLY